VSQESCKSTWEKSRQPDRSDEKNNWKKKLRKENWEKQIEKTKTKKREDEGEELKMKMKEKKVGSKK